MQHTNLPKNKPSRQISYTHIFYNLPLQTKSQNIFIQTTIKTCKKPSRLSDKTNKSYHHQSSTIACNNLSLSKAWYEANTDSSVTLVSWYRNHLIGMGSYSIVCRTCRQVCNTTSAHVTWVIPNSAAGKCRVYQVDQSPRKVVSNRGVIGRATEEKSLKGRGILNGTLNCLVRRPGI